MLSKIPVLVATLCFVAVIPSAIAAGDVEFFTGKSCSGGSQDAFQNIGCNTCLDPPGDFGAVSFSGLGSGQRVEIHNEDGCTAASLTGQQFGDLCFIQGATAIRSAFVAC